MPRPRWYSRPMALWLTTTQAGGNILIIIFFRFVYDLINNFSKKTSLRRAQFAKVVINYGKIGIKDWFSTLICLYE